VKHNVVKQKGKMGMLFQSLILVFLKENSPMLATVGNRRHDQEKEKAIGEEKGGTKSTRNNSVRIKGTGGKVVAVRKWSLPTIKKRVKKKKGH